MFFNKMDGLLVLKNEAENHYNPDLISKTAMEIYNQYSLEFSQIQQQAMLTLISMDMGEEFHLNQIECLDIINKLLSS